MFKKFSFLLLLVLNKQIIYCLNYDQSYSLYGRIWKIYNALTHNYLSPRYETPEIKDDIKYDFIIVGGGAAGCALANRLSEESHWNILLIEAGDTPNYITEIPSFSLHQFTTYNWGFKTEKQDNMHLGLHNQRMDWSRGKGLGGSTIISHLIYARGNKWDYVDWGVDNPGWNYSDVLPYFKKLEDSNVVDNDVGMHSVQGYLHVEQSPYRTKIAKVYVEGHKQLGKKYVDYNGKTQIGVSYIQGNIHKGFRDSAERAYLRPIRNRKNLKILLKTRVTKILIDPETKTAHGVTFYRNHRNYTVFVKKEIILAAGVFQSPQLLMLSGVGPKSELDRFNIPIIKNLPVGQKLYDHLCFLGLSFIADKPITNTVFNMINPISVLEYIFTKTGPLTVLFGSIETFSFMKSNMTNIDRPDLPDIELLLNDISLAADNGLLFMRALGISDYMYQNYFKPLKNKHAFHIVPAIMKPKSHGKIQLHSNNPFDSPKLYGNYLTDPENIDLKTMIIGIRSAIELINSPIFKEYGIKLYKKPIPGCEMYEFNTDDYWECSIRHISGTFNHQCGSCKMGKVTDREAVVDYHLKVIGIKRLRVVDASIAPAPAVAHTNAVTVMIAEKGADMIKDEWANNHRNL